jgi:hypothetical protein
MKGSRAGVVLGILMTLLAASLAAQRTSRASKPLTNAQLQARIIQLEDDNAVLMRNYDLLLASCQSQVERNAHPPAAGDPVAQDATTARDTTTGGVRRPPRNVDDDLFHIVDINYGVTETASTYMRFGWKVTIRNGLGRNEVFDLSVQFLDKNDLVIGTSTLGVQTIRAYGEEAVSGDLIIRLPAALNVASAKAVVNRHR